jgi:predicted HNH restriction endonuclease
MLFKFKSKNTGDIIMLQAHAQQILTILGRDTANGASDKGIVQAEQIPSALEALQNAIVAEETARDAAVAEAQKKGEPTPVFAEVSLRQRAQPFIEMMRRCESDGDDVVWGV